MGEEWTQIKVRKQTREELRKRIKVKGESYDDIIQRLLDDAENYVRRTVSGVPVKEDEG